MGLLIYDPRAYDADKGVSIEWVCPPQWVLRYALPFTYQTTRITRCPLCALTLTLVLFYEGMLMVSHHRRFYWIIRYRPRHVLQSTLVGALPALRADNNCSDMCSTQKRSYPRFYLINARPYYWSLTCIFALTRYMASRSDPNESTGQQPHAKSSRCNSCNREGQQECPRQQQRQQGPHETTPSRASKWPLKHSLGTSLPHLLGRLGPCKLVLVLLQSLADQWPANCGQAADARGKKTKASLFR